MVRVYGIKLIVVVWILLVAVLNVYSQTGRVMGEVYAITSEEPIPAANVYIPGLYIGTATDIDGHFYLSNVPVGRHRLRVSYIGYKDKEIPIEVKEGETVVVKVELVPETVKGDTIVVTAQADAQWQAINQQLGSMTVKNVVSKKQIEELPEANAAEAVGRLPGVSLIRSGGEGSKVVIRGMAAKYSLIQIDGVSLASTDQYDRSTDLSMISPYMLEGIELTKSIMANQEATATGGIVNFKIRKAPEEPTLNIVTQGGYNDLRSTFHNYKMSIGGSRRYYHNLLGIYAQLDYEKRDNGSQQLGGVNFSQENEEAPVRTNSVTLMDIFRDVRRLGSALVMDYTLPSTEIKLSNFYSRINREETRYSSYYGFSNQTFQISYTDIPESWLTIMTNSLKIEHRMKRLGIDATISHSYSENALPAEISSSNGNSPQTPFNPNRDKNYNVDLDPESIPDSLIIPMDEAVKYMYLGGIQHSDSKTRERDIAGELNLSYDFNISDKVKVKLSLGTKVKHKEKDFDQTTAYNNNEGGDQQYRNLVYEAFENEFSERTKESWEENNFYILLEDFLDDSYNGSSFLDGRYDFGYIFDKEKFRKIHDLIMKEYSPTISTRDVVVYPNFINSNYYDYYGIEDYRAFYVMPEIGFGTRWMFVPGVRYEYNRTEYTGYRGNRLGVLRDYTATKIDTVTKVRRNEFFLPMVHLFYKPAYWLIIKCGYTHTLQRPNYTDIRPSWIINSQGQVEGLGNFRLRPELSRNLDIQVSLYFTEFGMFSLGLFHKRIKDMIFWTGRRAILDPGYFELPESQKRVIAAYPVNNEYEAINYGYEVEWRSNFWYLPGILRGLVLSINYTRNESEARYLKTRIKTIVDPVTYKVSYENEDTTYTAPMILQPDHLLNIMLGFDYKGFSIRFAMRYKSHIFKSENWYEELRGYSTDFYRYDLSIKQRLPIEGLELFLNVNNLTDENERDVINHMNFTSYLEDYGRIADFGLRYNLR